MENHNLTIKQSFNILKLTFGIVPIVAGLDKFTNLLTNWEVYLSPTFIEISPLAPSLFMKLVGIIEIAAGIIVLKKPSIGAFIVAAWLTLIALLLISSGQFIDVAVRDLVMAITAFTIARTARVIS